MVPVARYTTNTVPATRDIFREIDMRYRSTFITKLAKHRNRASSTEQAMPHRIPSHTFWNMALNITPAREEVSIMASAAMFSRPAC